MYVFSIIGDETLFSIAAQMCDLATQGGYIS